MYNVIESFVDPLEPVDTTVAADVNANDIQRDLPSSSSGICDMLGTNTASSIESYKSAQMIFSIAILTWPN